MASFTPATAVQRLVAGVLVVIVSAAAAALWFVNFSSVESRVDHKYTTRWFPPPGILLSPGPASFQFDAGRNNLVVRGPIDSKLKQQLTNLVSKDGVAVFPPDPAAKTYWQSLDQLAFVSNSNSDRLALLLLLLGGLSGLLGVQLRSLINFIGVACFKNRLDVVRWWPWYAMRPPAGFIFGLAAMLLIQVGFFQPETASPDAVTWGIVIALLAGFGASEFADRLRLLAKTVFGESSQ